MLEDPMGDHVSIYNTKLRKRSFNTQFDRSKFIKDLKSNRLFENLTPGQQFLVDECWEYHQDVDFAKNKIRNVFFDIETYSPDSFPSVETGDHAINLITCHDSIEDKFYTWGLAKTFSPQKVEGADDIPLHKVKYIRCNTEEELLERFLCWIEDDYPDIISGWNSEGFDIPYILVRIANILSEEDTKRLSPVGRVYFRMKRTMFGTEVKRWYIEGISCVDYLDVYKRFKMKMQPSYKLDYIAEAELGYRKLEFGDMSLAELADTDWDRFTAYNIHDVNILVELDKKLEFIALLRMLAYAGLTTFEQAMGTVSTVNGAAASAARARGEYISTFRRAASDEKNPGAYVGEPLNGFQHDIVSFDATSLYPTVMMSLNMSPETKVGNIIKVADDKITIRHVRGEVFDLTNKQFAQFIKKEQCALSKSKVLFSQKKEGLISGVVRHYFNQRTPVKKELIEAKKRLAKATSKKDIKDIGDLVSRLNAKQLCIKVLINATYGYFGNKLAPLGDDDIASSITLTGQAIIKESNEIVKRYFASHTGKDSSDYDNCVIYNDTDSCYISFSPLLDHLGIKFNDGEVITEDTYEIVATVETHLNAEIEKWAKSSLFATKPCFSFKREMLADVGIFLAKKRYILHYMDDEGVKKPDFKYTGVDVVRTTMPNSIKPKTKAIAETMLLTESQAATNNALSDAYDTFLELDEVSIAKTSGMSSYDKWATQCKGMQFAKGMPYHVKAAHAYNFLLDELDIANKYEKLTSGDKVKSFHVLQPNKYGLGTIAFKYEYPDEFKDLFKIDYEKMFEKVVFSMVTSLYEAVNWTPRKMNQQVQVDLFSLFGG